MSVPTEMHIGEEQAIWANETTVTTSQGTSTTLNAKAATFDWSADGGSLSPPKDYTSDVYYIYQAPDRPGRYTIAVKSKKDPAASDQAVINVVE